MNTKSMGVFIWALYMLGSSIFLALSMEGMMSPTPSIAMIVMGVIVSIIVDLMNRKNYE